MIVENNPSSRKDAAGVAFVAPGGLALFVRRSNVGDHAGEWCFPGGMIEGNETPEQAARRESLEEVGFGVDGELHEVSASPIDGGPGLYTTFLSPVSAAFSPTTNDEVSGHGWFPIDDPPSPLHPGLSESIAGTRSTKSDLGLDAALAFDRSPEGMNAPARARREGLAFDRSSVRSYDVDGRLRVEVTNISKANICPYVGHEIPGWEELGLKRDAVYQLLRDPDELERAAPTFNNLPLMSEHVAVTADDHQPDLVIGATGTDAVFEAPYLRNSLVVWAQGAIDDIRSEGKKELSSAYRYRPDMTPGEYLGARYDGVMRDIIGNHVALVKEGRAGQDVVVGDEAPEEFTQENLNMAKKYTIRSAITLGAISAYLQPRLLPKVGVIAFDEAMLNGLTAKNFPERKAGILTSIKKAVAGKLAKDASIDGLEEVLDMLENGRVGGSSDADPEPQKGATTIPAIAPITSSSANDDDDDVPAFLKGKLSEDDFDQYRQMTARKAAKDKDPKLEQLGAAGDDDGDDSSMQELSDNAAKDEPPDFPGKPKPGGSQVPMSKRAMDQAIAAAVKTAHDAATKTQRDIREAEREVRPWVGELQVSFDSAEAVYRHALSMLGVGHADVHASALKHVLGVQPRPGSAKTVGHQVVALDAARQKSFADRFPEAARLRSA